MRFSQEFIVGEHTNLMDFKRNDEGNVINYTEKVSNKFILNSGNGI